MKTWRLFGSFIPPYWWRLPLALLGYYREVV